MAAIGLTSPPMLLTGFPVKTIGRNRNLWRVTRRPNGPWWFNSDMGCRFDLVAPQGTCYVAFDPLAAVVEVLAPSFITRVTPASFFTARELWCLKPPTTIHAGDTTSAGAFRFGITAEIGSIVPHHIPQQWAEALSKAGHDGIHYHLRHPPGPFEALAIFGPHGEQPAFPVRDRQDIDDSIVTKLVETFGVEVIPVPRAAELRVI